MWKLKRKNAAMFHDSIPWLGDHYQLTLIWDIKQIILSRVLEKADPYIKNWFRLISDKKIIIRTIQQN